MKFLLKKNVELQMVSKNVFNKHLVPQINFRLDLEKLIFKLLLWVYLKKLKFYPKLRSLLWDKMLISLFDRNSPPVVHGLQ